MKRTWRRLAPALTALVLTLALCPAALAAGPESEPEAQTVPAAAPAPAPSAVYPAEVRETEENGVHRIEKVYYLTRSMNVNLPCGTVIPTASGAISRCSHTTAIRTLRERRFPIGGIRRGTSRP